MARLRRNPNKRKNVKRPVRKKKAVRKIVKKFDNIVIGAQITNGAGMLLGSKISLLPIAMLLIIGDSPEMP